jgi:protein TonB
MSNRDLFSSVSHTSSNSQSGKPYTIVVSMVVHAVLGAVLLIVPLLAADVLPSPPAMLAFVSAAPPPPPPPIAPRTSTASSKPSPVSNPDAAPVDAPDTIVPESGVIAEASDEPASLVSGVSGVAGSFGTQVIEAPPPPPKAAPVIVVHVGGKVEAPQKIHHVSPDYPAMARLSRVQGLVIIEATIGPDGRIQGAKVLRSVPLLDQAAVDAVRQWEFTPTRLNGVPVAVVMTVTVNFTLQ